MFILSTAVTALQAPKISWADLRQLVERNLPTDIKLVRDIESNGRTIAFAPNYSTTSEKPMPLTYTAQVTRRPHWFSTSPAGAFLYVTLRDEFTDERSRFEYDSNTGDANFTCLPSEKPLGDEDKPTLKFTSHDYPDGIPDPTSIKADDPFYQKDRRFTGRTAAHHWGCLLALQELKQQAYYK